MLICTGKYMSEIHKTCISRKLLLTVYLRHFILLYSDGYVPGQERMPLDKLETSTSSEMKKMQDKFEMNFEDEPSQYQDEEADKTHGCQASIESCAITPELSGLDYMQVIGSD